MQSPCIPNRLPITNLPWREILPLCGRANASLARYDGMLQTLPDSSILLSPITANEAVLSSKIEGTQATLDEVLEADAGLIFSDRRRGDIEEISNYRAAVSIAEESLAERPLSLSLIKAVHQRLLQGVRGLDKTPGQFREDQNWIGRKGDPIDKARFIPPSPAVLPGALDDWAAYMGSDEDDPILQSAVVHAQFEILHPFRDGNGRIGRMLIPLLLYQRAALSRPMFYMSEFLEAHRGEYFDRLLAITANGDWYGWIVFFLDGVAAQADGNLEKVRRVRELYDECQRIFQDITHSQFAMAAVNAFFRRPVIQSTVFAREAGFNNRVTANNMLRQLENAGAITRLREGSGSSAAIYALPSLINIAEGKPVVRAGQRMLF